MIRLENVSKIYPDGTEAVKNVSLGVGEGELCVLLGPSGCGKTTTMKMVNRIIPITEGEIYIKGVDNAQIDENELRKDIGYAIQEIGLFPHMTVRQNIETVPSLKGWDKTRKQERTKELLQLVRLDSEEFMDKYPSELSGGQRQRVGVARCLGADPPILLMDEPFGAIDPITRVELQAEFLKIQQDIKKTIIFVTHDIYEAIKMGDKIALMAEGELVQYDTPAHILYKPKDEFVENFVGADRAVKGLQLIRAKEVMDSSPSIVKLDEKARAVCEGMQENDIDWTVVTDDDGKFLGWVSKKETEEATEEKTVKDIMSYSEGTATINMVLSEVLSLMLSSGVKSLPIVGGDNKLTGIVSFDAIQQALMEAEKRSEP